MLLVRRLLGENSARGARNCRARASSTSAPPPPPPRPATETDPDRQPYGLKDSKQIVDEVAASSADSVKLAVSDIDGILRGKYVAKSKFLSAAKGGLGFCSVIYGWDSSDVLYDNVKFTGWHTGYPDAKAEVDLFSYRRIPWEGETPFFLLDLPESGVCPRTLLRRVIQQTRDAGYEPMVGMEYEWFNFSETSNSLQDKHYTQPRPVTPGMFGYSLIRMGQNAPFFKALFSDLLKFRVPLEGLHTETGPGVYEAAIMFSSALEAADRAILFKTGAKEIGHRFQIMPSFMAKWHQELPGCSGHMHESLHDPADRRNLFHDERDAPHKMSSLFKHFIAGQLALLPDLLPMYAPTVNSYKRLVDGYWAPTHPTWGVDNRTVALRALPGSAKSSRLETRVPGSDSNPYVALAAGLASGLYGVLNRLPLKEGVVGSAYGVTKEPRLPRTLQHATERMAKSPVVRELFGDSFVDHFVATREWEWRQFQDAITDWETRRYFEIV